MKHPLRIIIIISALFLLFSAVGPGLSARAQQDSITIEAAAGYDGFYKSGFWVPVHITLANNGVSVAGEVRVIDNDPTPSDRLTYRTPLSLPNQSNKRVTLYVYLPDPVSNLDVEFVTADGDRLASTTTNRLTLIPESDRLFGVVTPDPGEFAFLENISSPGIDSAVAFLTLAELPEIGAAWNGLDVLIFNDVDAAQLTSGQRQALETWVNTGGQLVLTGGSNWQKTTAGLESLLPVEITGSESIANLPGLAETAGIPFRDPGPYLVTTSRLQRGELLFFEEILPILAGVPAGRGAVYFLALDPRFAPLLDWDGTEAIFTAVVNRIPPASVWGSEPSASFAAENAVTNLPELSLPSVWQMVLFLLIYVVVVGPVNYLVLKRRNQLEKAWITIPLLIIAFTIISYITGFQLRGNVTIINQMTVAYSHTDGEQSRVHSLVGLYSPRRTNYDLLFPADTLARPFSNIFGGGFGNNRNLEAITYNINNSIDGVRVDISDIETFTAQTDRPALNFSGQSSLTRSDNRTTLTVNLQNNSETTLKDAVLLFGSTIINVGDISPGQTISENALMTVALAGNAPFTSNANTILGFDYYNDPELFPRYQFLEAIEGNAFGSTTKTLPANSVLLMGWSDEPIIDVTTADGGGDQVGTTLYLVEIPIK